MLLNCVVIEILTHHWLWKETNVFCLKSHHIIIVSRRGTYFLLPAAEDRRVSRWQHCMKHRHKQTDSGFFSTYKLHRQWMGSVKTTDPVDLWSVLLKEMCSFSDSKRKKLFKCECMLESLPFSVWSFAFCIVKSLMERWHSSAFVLYSVIWSSNVRHIFSRLDWVKWFSYWYVSHRIYMTQWLFSLYNYFIKTQYNIL